MAFLSQTTQDVLLGLFIIFGMFFLLLIIEKFFFMFFDMFDEKPKDKKNMDTVEKN
jgi:hypothetical protein